MPSLVNLADTATYLIDQLVLQSLKNIEKLKARVTTHNGFFKEGEREKDTAQSKPAASSLSSTNSSAKSPAAKKPHLSTRAHYNKRIGPAFRKVSASKYRSPRGRPLPQLRNGSGGTPGISNIEWPNSTFFEPEIGRSKIVEFIEKTWDYETEKLEYTVDHVYSAKLKTTKRFKYRVCWINRPEKNERASTASVYFNIDIPLTPDTPIDITYTFQGDRHLHKPGRSRYHHKWLKYLGNGSICVGSSA